LAYAIAFSDDTPNGSRNAIVVDVVANDDSVITFIDSTVGDESGEIQGGNVYAQRQTGCVVLRTRPFSATKSPWMTAKPSSSRCLQRSIEY